MGIKIRNRQDFWAGLAFIFISLLTLTISERYPMGTAARMGPGFFPFILGSILALLGFSVAARSLFAQEVKMDPFFLRPLVLILGAVLAFAIFVEPFGLVLAILGLVVISSLAEAKFRLWKVILLCLMLASMGVGVFVYALGLPFRVWPL